MLHNFSQMLQLKLSPSVMIQVHLPSPYKNNKKHAKDTEVWKDIEQNGDYGKSRLAIYIL